MKDEKIKIINEIQLIGDLRRVPLWLWEDLLDRNININKILSEPFPDTLAEYEEFYDTIMNIEDFTVDDIVKYSNCITVK